MLGANYDGNDWKYAVLNFLVVFFAQLGFGAYEDLQSGRFPTPFECYKMVIVAFVTTLSFYGINKIVYKEAKE